MKNFVKDAIGNYQVSGRELIRLEKEAKKLEKERLALGITTPGGGEKKLLRQMAIARDTLLFARLEAERAIDLIDERPLALVLKCRYIDGLTAEETAEASGYCLRHVHRITRRAKEEGII